jgi:ubiquinone/menaquinone biosynthesis C-methylase UbiE
MPAHYDYYDYPSYWQDREYEHNAEIIALREMFAKIPKIKSLIDIGAGYGRLTPEYSYRVKKIVLCDPSARLLKIARKNFGKSKNIEFVQSKIENLGRHFRGASFDAAIMVRVIHHIEDPDKAIKIIAKILKKRGYLIIEHANKRHFKATMSEILKGNFTFPLDIFPRDVRCPKNIKKKTIPFINYHPDDINKMLKDNGFEIIERRSVSNFRNSFLKHLLPPDLLLSLEKKFQNILEKINFGPSIFILARKIEQKI